jgi:hypothetical protein
MPGASNPADVVGGITAPPSTGAEPPAAAEPPPSDVDGEQGASADLGRIAWSFATLMFALAALILLMDGYYGYATVTFAVAVAAGINLL